MSKARKSVEWPTLVLLIFCYVVWALATTWAAAWFLPLGIALAIGAGALHSSLSHEVLHGHPFGNSWASEATVFPALTMFIPYLRFRDTHLAHHNNEILTDPYDDPESNYMDPAVWGRMAVWHQMILRFNNTLFGRMLIGPLVSQVGFMGADLRAILGGDRAVLMGWLWHIPSVALVIWWYVSIATMPLWAGVLSAYFALSILKIRTFLEHRANNNARARTVIIADRGPLAVIFLNNNLHAVHHMHPGMAWYDLPNAFAKDRARYLDCNGDYYFASYAQIFRRYFFRAKDPVPHPLWRKR